MELFVTLFGISLLTFLVPGGVLSPLGGFNSPHFWGREFVPNFSKRGGFLYIFLGD